MMTVNDLLNLMALEDDVFITGYKNMYHNGLVEDVPDKVKSMEAHAIIPCCTDDYGYNTAIQILVDE